MSACIRTSSHARWLQWLWPPQGGEEDATTTTAECDGDGQFVVLSLLSNICRKDDRPASWRGAPSKEEEDDGAGSAAAAAAVLARRWLWG